jgi:hypothetical protein
MESPANSKWRGTTLKATADFLMMQCFGPKPASLFWLSNKKNLINKLLSNEVFNDE